MPVRTSRQRLTQMDDYAMATRQGIPIKTAVFSRPVAAAIAAITKSPLARSAMRKVPILSKFVPGSSTRISQAERALGLSSFQPSTAIAVRGPTALARVKAIAKPAAKITAVGAAFGIGEEVVSRIVDKGFSTQVNVKVGRDPNKPFISAKPREVKGGPMPRGLAVGQELPPSHQVVRTWQTFPGGPMFARLADGHIAVTKKDGTIKHYRPYRPVVIPKKWDARSMRRVATALKRQRKTATKIMQLTGGMPKGRK